MSPSYGHRYKEKHLKRYPYRKFAIVDGRVLVGHLITEETDEDYHHAQLVHAIQDSCSIEEPVDVTAGWIYGDDEEVTASVVGLEPQRPVAFRTARRRLREWAAFTGKRVTFREWDGS